MKTQALSTLVISLYHSNRHATSGFIVSPHQFAFGSSGVRRTRLFSTNTAIDDIVEEVKHIHSVVNGASPDEQTEVSDHQPDNDEHSSLHPDKETIEVRTQQADEPHIESHSAESQETVLAAVQTSETNAPPVLESEKSIPTLHAELADSKTSVVTNEAVESAPTTEETKSVLANFDKIPEASSTDSLLPKDEAVLSEHPDERLDLIVQQQAESDVQVIPVEKDASIAEHTISTPSGEATTKVVVADLENGPSTVDISTGTVNPSVEAKTDALFHEHSSTLIEKVPAIPKTDSVRALVDVPDTGSTTETLLDTTSSDIPRTLGALTNEREFDTTQVSDIKQALVNALCMMHSRVSDVLIPSSQQALSKFTNDILPTATRSALQGSLDLLNMIERTVQEILDSL